MTDAERIADGLSEAQRAVLVHPDNRLDVWPNDRRVEKALIRKGLIEEAGFRSVCDWTQFGLQVRQILMDRGRE